MFDHTESKLNINYPERRKKLRVAFIEKNTKRMTLCKMVRGERGFGQIRNASGARRNAHFIISKSIIKDRTGKGTARVGGAQKRTGKS